MDLIKELTIGKRYSKKELASIFEEPLFDTIQTGIFSFNDEGIITLWVDLDKTEKKFSYNDYFDGDYFHWDSQDKQHIDTDQIQKIVTYNWPVHLFIRIEAKIKNKTQPFVYAGRLEYLSYDTETSNPVHLLYKALDYKEDASGELSRVYNWSPGKSEDTLPFEGPEQSNNSQKKNRKPTVTERSGLITSRVGQGFYRREVIEKWNGKCPVTGCSDERLLIASHIKKWSESNDHERLDPENGILLSPSVDALFDRKLISFNQKGELVKSPDLADEVLSQLGISLKTIIPVTDGMKKYLSDHFEKTLKN